ncbi:pyridoxamine 5'-phosphate oxidase family protein [Dolichospermum circinale CS-534/05]|uniref:Npun_F5749 family FMN-dependent PPOX-type flavoprotein n=1 Tax=Dolichospermum circinale TaxID=109265 RepID=UPI00232EABBE|nr:Npun_F5749 family FMN-dependent PPOX-type flavoprotein [Dolichospermum circinale]MDB9490372.1 pyridoxamine 5'-phosphate oxidase family protein [Dolichospermum circinale CS-534/05]
MSLAPWKSLITRALHHNRSLAYSRYVQLATIKENGFPANRTVVFRGFLEDTNELKFITDIRSAKAEQISKQPVAEVCWYFPKTREQFRITGELTLISDDSDINLQPARIKMWQELSDAARLQFCWPHPGKMRITTATAFTPPAPNPIEPVENFCLLLLAAIQVDHLELRGEPQNRWVYYRNENQEWLAEAINP